MLVDDAWATIGSCNLHAHSLHGNSEMNVSFWSPAVTRDLRCALFAEHLGTDTADLDHRAAQALFGRVARGNATQRERDDPNWQGIAFALSADRYAR